MPWRPVDIVAVILAASIGVALLITVIVPLIIGEPITDARARFVASVANTMIAVLSVYVGAKLKSGE